jgi:hypothetical protein
VLVEGNDVIVMRRNLRCLVQHSTENRAVNSKFSAVFGGSMDDELKKGWEQIEQGLTKAMARLSDAIEKAKNEMPDAMKTINEEYMHVQEALDRAVDKLRK